MNKPPRRYPPAYEHIFPIALSLVGVLVLVLLIVTLAVLLGWIGWS